MAHNQPSALFFLTLFVLMLFFTACRPAGNPTFQCEASQLATGKGGITGQVINLEQTPEPGARIAINYNVMATADANGKFCLLNLAPASYNLSADSSLQGSEPQSINVLADSVTRFDIQFSWKVLPLVLPTVTPAATLSK